MTNEYVSAQKILEIMESKEKYLNQLAKALEIQSDCFERDTFDELEYEKLQEKRDEYIAEINSLNDQFDETIKSAKEEILRLISKKHSLAEKIHKETKALTKLSKSVDEKSLEIKGKMEEYLNLQRKEIKNKLNQRKTAATYYKTMTKQAEIMSYLYDQTK